MILGSKKVVVVWENAGVWKVGPRGGGERCGVK